MYTLKNYRKLLNLCLRTWGRSPDELGVELSEAIKEGDKEKIVRMANSMLTELRGQVTENAGLQAEILGLQSDLDKVAADKNKLQKDLDTANAEKKGLQSDLNKVAADKNKLQKDLDTVTKEKDGLQSDLNKVAADKNKLQKDLDTAKEELDTANADKKALQGKLDTAKKERNQAEAANSDLKRDIHQKELEDARKRGEELLKEMRYEVKKNDNLTKIVKERYGLKDNIDIQEAIKILIESQKEGTKLRQRLEKTNGNLIIYPGDVLEMPLKHEMEQKLEAKKKEKENKEKDVKFLGAEKFYKGKEDLVKKLQKTFGKEENGTFSKDLYDAIIAFQEANGLKIDGKAGPITLKKIEELKNKNTNKHYPFLMEV